jgi:hypothetical protein
MVFDDSKIMNSGVQKTNIVVNTETTLENIYIFLFKK